MSDTAYKQKTSSGGGEYFGSTIIPAYVMTFPGIYPLIGDACVICGSGETDMDDLAQKVCTRGVGIPELPLSECHVSLDKTTGI
jgi:hypothetical protein